MIDNLGGRLGSFDRLEKELSPGRRWSNFDRAIGAGAFFADRLTEAREQTAQPSPEAMPRQSPARRAA
jgi:3'-5' exoribonuclease